MARLGRSQPFPRRPGKRVIAAASANVLITPGTATLTITAYAPTVSVPRLVTPTTATLTITTYAPAVRVPRLITPSTAALVITTYAPTVTVTTGGGVTITPGTATLTIVGYAPTVTVTETPGRVVTLVGVPGLPRRRQRQMAEGSGVGLIAVTGAGTVTGEAALAGEFLVVVYGHAMATCEAALKARAIIASAGDAWPVLVAVLGGGYHIETIGTATIAGSRMGYGEGAAVTAGIGTWHLSQDVGARFAIPTAGEGTGELDDEQAALWLLGLPSEIGV